ncbi:hypothetical protein BI313_18550 [Xanthomonas vesicatoria]|nr:hypothetical protein BI313_18550 [Xanthomonas vesicatoria]OLR69105.1 hypothetical protein BI311_25440 [Xanthomonas citri pv. citri]
MSELSGVAHSVPFCPLSYLPGGLIPPRRFMLAATRKISGTFTFPFDLCSMTPIRASASRSAPSVCPPTLCSSKGPRISPASTSFLIFFTIRSALQRAVTASAGQGTSMPERLLSTDFIQIWSSAS